MVSVLTYTVYTHFLTHLVMKMLTATTPTTKDSHVAHPIEGLMINNLSDRKEQFLM